MKLGRLTIALYVLLIFLSGIVLGAFGHRLYTVSEVSANAPRNPEEFRKRFLAEMHSRLSLTADQEKQLVGILDETRSQFRATRDSINPQMEKIREAQHQLILGILSKDQQAEYEKMRTEREEEMRRNPSLRPPR
jgi:uncharacterized protein YneF (UPF0154 family)